MNTHAVRANRCKLLILAALVLLCAAGYMLIEVNFSNPKLFAYAMKIRTPKLIVMLITAFSIGGASLVFQSIINNTILTGGPGRSPAERSTVTSFASSQPSSGRFS